MNRVEVIATIKTAGSRFASVMASLCSDEYVSGYQRAISDMTRLFSQVAIDENFEAERARLYAEIKRLKVDNELLSQDCAKQQATIDELLKHVDLHEVLGIGENNKQRGTRR